MGHLRTALGALSASAAQVSRSGIWETDPIGPAQPNYLNAVAVFDTLLGPRPLLDLCLGIEHDAGRIRRERWGPRSIDLDVLLYSDAELDAPGLRVPHPRMCERRFVLEPLSEAWPGVEIPGHGPVEWLLESVADQHVTRTTLDW